MYYFTQAANYFSTKETLCNYVADYEQVHAACEWAANLHPYVAMAFDSIPGNVALARDWIMAIDPQLALGIGLAVTTIGGIAYYSQKSKPAAVATVQAQAPRIHSEQVAQNLQTNNSPVLTSVARTPIARTPIARTPVARIPVARIPVDSAIDHMHQAFQERVDSENLVANLHERLEHDRNSNQQALNVVLPELGNETRLPVQSIVTAYFRHAAQQPGVRVLRLRYPNEKEAVTRRVLRDLQLPENGEMPTDEAGRERVNQVFTTLGLHDRNRV